jgi:hypothetical protein
MRIHIQDRVGFIEGQDASTCLPQDPGQPGEHLGISHTLKHYLNPSELWQDVAQAVEEPLRPIQFLEAHYRHDTPWDRWGNQANDRDVQLWETLSDLYFRGYQQVINDYCAAPPDGTVVRRSENRMIRTFHLGDGILLEVFDGRPWRMRTAHRTTGVELASVTGYLAIPKHIHALGRRLRQARARANRKLSVLSSHEVVVRDEQ